MHNTLRILCLCASTCLLVCTCEEPKPEYVVCDLCEGLTCGDSALAGTWIPQSSSISVRTECDTPVVLACDRFVFGNCTYIWRAPDSSMQGHWYSAGYWTARDSVLFVQASSTVEASYNLYPRPLDGAWQDIDDNDDTNAFVNNTPRRYSSGDCTPPTGCDTTRASRWVYALLDSTHLSLKQCCSDTCVDVGVFVKQE
jgi:hypothetical protein